MLANAAIQPDDPAARPPSRKSDCPPKVANWEGVNTAPRRVILKVGSQLLFDSPVRLWPESPLLEVMASEQC